MNKMFLALILLPMGSCAMDSVSISGENVENLAQELLVNGESQWYDVCPEVQELLVREFLHNHPLMHFLSKQPIHVLNTLSGLLDLGADYGVAFDEVWVTSAEFNRVRDRRAIPGLNEVKVLDSPTGECVAIFEHADVREANFNRAGDRLVTLAHGEVKIWNVSTGECVATFEHNWASDAKFNRAGDRLVTCGDDKLKIWDISTDECVATFEHARLKSVQFNRAGDRLVTRGVGSVKIWDVSTGACVATLEHANVDSVQFNRAEDRLVTLGGRVGRVKIWNVSTGECVATFEHDGSTDAKFNRAEDRLATRARKGVKIWDLSTLLLKDESYVMRRFTLKQAIILDAVYEVILARARVKIRGEEAFVLNEEPLAPGQITFDFNTYPHLWEDYLLLPAAIQLALDQYITKMTTQQSANQETL